MSLLIFTFLCSFLSAFAPLLVKILMSWIHQISKEEIHMQNEANSLKKQMDEISMVDEFAKYAKLQRKLIKIKDELKQKATARLCVSVKKKIILTYSLHAVVGLILLCVAWYYRNVPVIIFPEQSFWPIADILSWPTGVPGGISTVVWIFLSNKVARMVAAWVMHRNSGDSKKGTKMLENNMRIMEKLSFFMQPRANDSH